MENVLLLCQVDQRQRLRQRLIGGGLHFQFIPQRFGDSTESDLIFSYVGSSNIFEANSKRTLFDSRFQIDLKYQFLVVPFGWVVARVDIFYNNLVRFQDYRVVRSC